MPFHKGKSGNLGGRAKGTTTKVKALEDAISMVKGLSKLQKEILKIAYRNRGRMSEYGDVKNSEVLIEFYNFPAHPPGPYHTSGKPQIFNRVEIGIKKYKAASVSVVKSFYRLVERGLAQRKQNHGIILTKEGMKIAKALK